MNHKPSRRQFVAASTLAAAGGIACMTNQLCIAAIRPLEADNSHLFKEAQEMISYCLNTSTINGGELPIREQLKIAADAGYDAIEVWLRDVDRFVKEGGQLSDLRKEIGDLGLRVDSAIAFGNWIVDDDAARAQGLEQCRRDMATLQAIGGLRIAAPPVGGASRRTCIAYRRCCM